MLFWVAIASTVLFHLESPRQIQAFLEISLNTEIESPLFNFSSVMKFTELSEQNETYLINVKSSSGRSCCLANKPYLCKRVFEHPFENLHC